MQNQRHIGLPWYVLYRPRAIFVDYLCPQLLQAAKGLLYLHTRAPSIIHGAIKPENLIVTDSGPAAWCYFGLYLTSEMASPPAGQIKHEQVVFEAPELFQKQKRTKESDIWAFGVLMLWVRLCLEFENGYR